MADSPVGICLLGSGVVGSGVVRILTEQAELLRQRTGVRFDIRHVVVRDVALHAAAQPALPWRAEGAANAAIDDPATKVVVELIGGTTTAGALVERALRLGKPVVTANK